MSMKDKYVIHSHISDKKFREIIHLFSEDLSATQISHLTNIYQQLDLEYLNIARISHHLKVRSKMVKVILAIRSTLECVMIRMSL